MDGQKPYIRNYLVLTLAHFFKRICVFLSECPCRGSCWNFRSHSIIRRVNSPNAGCERARENKRVILELEGLSLSLDFSVKLCDIIISFLPEFYLTMGMMIHPCARAAGVCPWRTPPTQWWRWHLRRPCWTGHTSWFMQPGSQHLVVHMLRQVR